LVFDYVAIKAERSDLTRTVRLADSTTADHSSYRALVSLRGKS
jgi:hypothetical protein